MKLQKPIKDNILGGGIALAAFSIVGLALSDSKKELIASMAFGSAAMIVIAILSETQTEK